jgi:hypothetical protein
MWHIACSRWCWPHLVGACRKNLTFCCSLQRVGYCVGLCCGTVSWLHQGSNLAVYSCQWPPSYTDERYHLYCFSNWHGKENMGVQCDDASVRLSIGLCVPKAVLRANSCACQHVSQSTPLFHIRIYFLFIHHSFPCFLHRNLISPHSV